MASKSVVRRWCHYLGITIACMLSFSWLVIHRNFIPRQHFSIAPSRLTHGFGLPKLSVNEAVYHNEKSTRLDKNFTRFELDYGKYGKGVLTQTNCLTEILIFGSINNMVHYPELAPVLNLFRENVGFSDTAHVMCPDNCVVGVRVATEKEYFSNMDVILLGMLPKNFGGQLDSLSAIKPTQGQTWIYYSTESPLRVLRWVQDMELQNIRYHKSMTYHMDSEIPQPFGYFVQSNTSRKVYDEGLPNFAKNKTHLIAWMVSNCDEIFWSRSMFVEDLMVYIHVDVYGRCGSLKCTPRDSEECDWMLSKYKFYLALANSECRHYITEKFWKTALKHNIVPVIYGAPKTDVDRFAPPNSYIHIADFSSTEELANYLTLIDKNDTLYNSFFEWKKRGYVRTNFPPQPSLFCDILSHLDSNQEPKMKLQTLGESPWWRTCRYDVTMTSAVYTKHQKLAVQYKKWKPWNVTDPR